MKRALFFAALFIFGATLFCQEDMRTVYRQRINEALSQRDCDQAQKIYDAYKKSASRDTDIEAHIKACREGRAPTQFGPAYYKEKVNEALKNGACDLAQTYYNSYRIQDANIEAQIKECKERKEGKERIAPLPAPTLDESWRKLVEKTMNSHATNSWKNGDRYKGQKNELLDGLGVYRWKEGYLYFGRFYDGKMTEYGIFITRDFEKNDIENCRNCAIYVGGWSTGKKSGQGSCYDKTGKLIYYGNFLNDKPVETYPAPPTISYDPYKFRIFYENGNIYLGETKDGKKHGQGIYLRKNGDMWYGPWENDIRTDSSSGIDILNDGTIRTGRWVGNDYTR